MRASGRMDIQPTQSRPLLLTGVLATAGLLSVLLGPNLKKQLLLGAITLFLVRNKRYLWIDITAKTIKRDLLAGVGFLIFNVVARLWTSQKKNVVKVFEDVVKKNKDKNAFVCEDQAWTFGQANEFSNKVATYFKQQGYQRGDTVALFMENRIEYVPIWLGLAKIGVVTALINTNLKDKPLHHSITVAGSKALIYTSELKQAVQDVKEELKDVKLYEYGNGNESDDLKKTLDNIKPIDLSQDIAQGDFKDKILYIYTSGTTGLPKAAIITSGRVIFMAYGCGTMLRITDKDIIYNSLPLYHTTGGIVGVGQTLLKGSTLAIRKKFSASNYWTDCIKYKCTVGIYIGEICRYLLATPSKPTDTQHSLKLLFGNGLKASIWKSFVERFNIPRIGEVYGATEGNSNLVNIDGKIGAVGFVPRIATALYPVVLIKVDAESEEPIRGADGFCIQCGVGEPGMLVGKIDNARADRVFAGYADRQASEKKVLKDVLTKGDQYFNSGDMLVMDEYGYFYFKDRTGDTFRWKSENVSTNEVEAVISNLIELKDSTVYGVEVPNTEGKAGMAAICDPHNKLDLTKLNEGLQKALPAYARPIFIRLLDELPMTGTFKLKKKELQNESYNPSKVKDRLFMFDSKQQQFVTLDDKLYNDIQKGVIRF